MPDTPHPANEAPITEDSSMVEEVTEQVGTTIGHTDTEPLPEQPPIGEPPLIVEGTNEQVPIQNGLPGEEEIEEELIIEDFTIDGICGVY